ncbi:MAG: cysteine-rich CWC family protein [Hylemonella sp.]|uniref:cysteine-rich CWC family protein n=1 Tax=Hylemonella sp. TaxID=2066020 RepID=UPI0022BB3276|nr:cysteine-rich CWC family protein [Hylemonella sp.]MCZ8253038.1 cysteine-rich CWC family protein [Hylemonella sp.]
MQTALPSSLSAVDPCRCPLCGQPNACGNEVARATGQAQPPCWCTTVTFTSELLARVPLEAQRQACICAACARAAAG